MKTYELNGRLYRFADDKVPAGAKLHGKAPAPVKAEPKQEEAPEQVETKAKKAPANKSRKAGSNK
jgi:hypothetical protein